MTESFDLKPLATDAVERALERARHYRLLNEPVEAESICLDILEVDPDAQDALVVLLLALTYQPVLGGRTRDRRVRPGDPDDSPAALS